MFMQPCWLLFGSKPTHCINNVVDDKTVAFVYVNRKGAQTNGSIRVNNGLLVYCIYHTHLAGSEPVSGCEDLYAALL